MKYEGATTSTQTVTLTLGELAELLGLNADQGELSLYLDEDDIIIVELVSEDEAKGTDEYVPRPKQRCTGLDSDKFNFSTKTADQINAETQIRNAIYEVARKQNEADEKFLRDQIGRMETRYGRLMTDDEIEREVEIGNIHLPKDWVWGPIETVVDGSTVKLVSENSHRPDPKNNFFYERFGQVQ